MAKRGNGEGSISKRSDGRWQGQISLGRDVLTGKIKRPTFYGKTRKEVADKIKLALADYHKGVFIEKKNITFQKYLLQWLQTKKIAISSNTYAKYETLSRNHLIPALGDIELQKITRIDIQDFIAQKSISLSPKTIAELHMIIRNVIDMAVEDNIIIRNICNKIQLPTIKEPNIKILSEEEIGIVLRGCTGTYIYDPVFLTYSTGLRRGEALGLTYKDIDFKNSTININKSWVSIKGIPKWSDTATGTKTKSGKRVVAVPQAAMTMLRQRRIDHPDDTYVFQNKNGLPLNPNNYTRDLKKYIKKEVDLVNQHRLAENPKSPLVEISISPHSLRHNFATKLVALNVHDRLIQEQLGHRDLRATRRYTHAVLEDQQKAISLLDQHLSSVALSAKT